MKQIQKDELYENLSQFLKTRGIELKEGSYTKSVHAGCSMLADAINLSQAGLERAKNEFEKRIDQVRQVIHESTAPKQAEVKVKSPPPSSDKSQARAQSPRSGSKTRAGQPKSQRRPKAKASRKKRK